MHARESPRNNHRAADGAPLGKRAAEVVSEAASLARARAVKASHRALGFVSEHPLASLGVALAGGIAVGAVAHQLVAHRPSTREFVSQRLGLQRLRGAVCH